MQLRSFGVLFLALVGLMMPAATHAQTVSAGYGFTIALMPDGTVLTWGDNQFGQLGQGDTTDRPTPTPVPGLSNITAVSAGDQHAIALRSDGVVFAWGGAYRVGDGTSFQRNSPVVVSIPAIVTAIDGGELHSLALDNSGNVWAWGLNSFGQLGDGTNTTRLTPVTSAGLSPAQAISAGSVHSLAVKTGGAVWGSGLNSTGALGDGTTMTVRYTPVQMTGISGAVQVAAGMDFSLVVLGNLQVWGVGSNGYGQLCSNTGNRSTAAVTSLPGGLIAAGRSHSLARSTTGDLWVCGQNNQGQLGDGTFTNRFTPTLVSLTNVSAISGGPTHSAVMATSLTTNVWTWGNNVDGQLGDGTTTLSNVPLMVWQY